jgi:glycosyltransferase involved in cell wall biosynthesis
LAEERDGGAAQPRILFVLPALGAGGSERVVTSLLNHWAAAGRDVAVVTFESSKKPPYYALDPRVEIFPLDLPPVSKPKWRALHRTWQRIAALRRLFRRRRPDVVVSFLTKTNVMSLLAAQGLDTPVIISERNNPKLQTFDRLWRTARSFAYPRAFSFVTMTQGAAEYYPERQRPRLRLIPNPVNLPATWTNRRGGKTIAAVGRLTSQKRFDLLIDAFAAVASDFPDWKLVIWGEGELRENLEAQCESLPQNIRSRISLPGVTPSPGAWIESADIFVLSSEYEGWPNVVVEAMGAALPILASECEFGVSELISHNNTGLLAPVNDSQALAAGLRTLLDDEGMRARLAKNAAAEAAQYTIENISAQWDEIIGEAALKARRP